MPQIPAALIAQAAAVTGPLEPWGPRSGADVGDPQTSGIEFYAAADPDAPRVQVGVWECTPGGWSITDRPDTETMVLLAGRIRITDADGTEHALGAGDVFVLPKGWSGRWDVLETVRKVYVIND
jgi:uncharacterized cupin superfamily protein